MTRGQMATLVAKALELAPVAADFEDVEAEQVHAANIGAIVEAGIASGFPDGTLRPLQPVTRG